MKKVERRLLAAVIKAAFYEGFDIGTKQFTDSDIDVAWRKSQAKVQHDAVLAGKLPKLNG